MTAGMAAERSGSLPEEAVTPSGSACSEARRDPWRVDRAARGGRLSRAGTPADKGSAGRFAGTFKLAGAARRYLHLSAVLHAALNIYNQRRPHEGSGNLSSPSV